jgi:hypothetical protein
LIDVTDLSTESTEKRVPEVTQREREVLVEEIPKELAHAIVAPPTMNKQESLEVSKLGDGVIAG